MKKHLYLITREVSQQEETFKFTSLCTNLITKSCRETQQASVNWSWLAKNCCKMNLEHNPSSTYFQINKSDFGFSSQHLNKCLPWHVHLNHQILCQRMELRLSLEKICFPLNVWKTAFSPLALPKSDEGHLFKDVAHWLLISNILLSHAHLLKLLALNFLGITRNK